MIRPRSVTVTEPDAPAAESVVVEVADDQDDEPVDQPRWEALARLVLSARDITGPTELAITFVDADAMAELNQSHLGHEGPTDVLAFPIDGPDLAADPRRASAGPTMLGDVIVCPKVAAQNAPTHAGTYDEELALLITHGILHLLGHDHAEVDEAGEMQAEERRLLAQWNGSTT